MAEQIMQEIQPDLKRCQASVDDTKTVELPENFPPFAGSPSRLGAEIKCRCLSILSCCKARQMPQVLWNHILQLKISF